MSNNIYKLTFTGTQLTEMEIVPGVDNSVTIPVKQNLPINPSGNIDANVISTIAQTLAKFQSGDKLPTNLGGAKKSHRQRKNKNKTRRVPRRNKTN
jgi:hypothetical protein